MRNNSMILFMSGGLSARTFKTMIPGYFSGGYRRILAKSKSRVIMTCFPANAIEAISASGEAGGKMSLTSTALCPRASIDAFVERGRLASIRKCKEVLASLKNYFFFLSENRSIINTCLDVLIRHRRIFRLDFFIGHARSKRIEDHKYGNPSSLNAGFAVAHSRVYGYPFNKPHVFRILNFGFKSKLRSLKKSLFAVIARSGSDVAIYNPSIYIKARLLRYARNDNYIGFFSSLKLCVLPVGK